MISMKFCFSYRSNPAMVMIVFFVISVSVPSLSIVFIKNQPLKQVYQILVMILNYPMEISMDEPLVRMKLLVLAKIPYSYQYQLMMLINRRCLKKLIQRKKIRQLVSKRYFLKSFESNLL
jgi:hypothetical protein